MTIEWIAYILSAVAGIVSGVKSLSFVSEGERGVVLTFGKAKRDESGNVIVRGPGFRWVVPWAQRIVKVHLQKNTMHFPNMTVTLGNNLTYTFDAYISYHIKDEPKWVEHVLFTLEDSAEFVNVVFTRELQKHLWNAKELDFALLEEDLKRKVSRVLRADGIDVDSCGISSFAETPVSQAMRGIDYRISKALEFAGTMPDCILSAAIGATPIVSPSDCGPAYTEETVEE